MSTPAGKAGNDGKAGNEPFSEFGWKSWKTIGFSPALAGKARILFLGLIILTALLNEKLSYQEMGLKKKRLSTITWNKPFHSRSTED